MLWGTIVVRMIRWSDVELVVLGLAIYDTRFMHIMREARTESE